MSESKPLNNHNRTVAIVLVLAAIIGTFFYGKQYFPMSQVSQKLYTVTGNGIDLQNAFDTSLDSYWTGDGGRYGKYYYAVIDFGELIYADDVKVTLGGSGAPIDYMLNIQSSINGNIWNDVIGASDTGYFSEKTQFDFRFMSHKIRFIRVGIKLQGLQTQEMRVYDIKVNQ